MSSRSQVDLQTEPNTSNASEHRATNSSFTHEQNSDYGQTFNNRTGLTDDEFLEKLINKNRSRKQFTAGHDSASNHKTIKKSSATATLAAQKNEHKHRHHHRDDSHHYSKTDKSAKYGSISMLNDSFRSSGSSSKHSGIK